MKHLLLIHILKISKANQKCCHTVAIWVVKPCQRMVRVTIVSEEHNASSSGMKLDAVCSFQDTAETTTTDIFIVMRSLS